MHKSQVQRVCHQLGQFRCRSSRKAPIIEFAASPDRIPAGFLEPLLMTVRYDVFLCHNSKDKPAVIELRASSARRGLKPGSIRLTFLGAFTG